MTFAAIHISVAINRNAEAVYAFASDPANLPTWAAGLSGTIRKEGDDWTAESPMGLVKVKFAPKNTFGILDHEVTLPSGLKVYNPMRVFPNNDGAELIFSLYRRPEMNEDQFQKDAAMVVSDLLKLKGMMEK